MSYETKRKEHEEQKARVRAVLDRNDPRDAVIADLRAQLAAATARAEAAELSLELIEADNRDLQDAHRRIGELERALAAVPRQAIDALFRQQFGTYPVWFNEAWTPIAEWLGYKPARE